MKSRLDALNAAARETTKMERVTRTAEKSSDTYAETAHTDSHPNAKGTSTNFPFFVFNFLFLYLIFKARTKLKEKRE